MRSCVDLPDQSDHSTIMSVPGRSSVEKNTSFFLLLLTGDVVLEGVVFVGFFPVFFV